MLKMTYENRLKALSYLHLREHTSDGHLIQVIEGDDFARRFIAPDDGISRSVFSEDMKCRVLEYMQSMSGIPLNTRGEKSS